MKFFTFKIFFCALLMTGCNANPDLEKDRAELLRLHEAQRQYHFEKKGGDFAALMSDPTYSVNRGKVSQATQAENQSRFQTYFENVNFVNWEDVQDPIIRISADGNMAYVIVQKNVVIDYSYAPGDTTRESNHFAWVSIYEKEEGKWKITCNASTNQEPTFNHSRAAGDMTREEMEVFQALEKFSQAFRAADDEALEEMLTDAYLHSNSGGAPTRKTDWLNYVRSRKKAIDNGELSLQEYRNEDIVIETYENAATVYGVNITKGIEKGIPFEHRIAFTHTWIREDGKWKRAAFHDTRLE